MCVTLRVNQERADGLERARVLPDHDAGHVLAQREGYKDVEHLLQ